jgi:hypothetical protein
MSIRRLIAKKATRGERFVETDFGCSLATCDRYRAVKANRVATLDASPPSQTRFYQPSCALPSIILTLT